jgi:hypothetical protein
MTVNTVEPAPVSEHSLDGDTGFESGPVRAGDSLVLYMHFQVNPTHVGHRSQTVRLAHDSVAHATACDHGVP